MARVYLIRHGKPAQTWGGSDDDPSLDATGRAQAEAARDWLMALPQGERPSRVVSSPLRRCRETAQPTADALGVALVIDPRVGEIPTPVGLSAEARPGWLREAFQGTWGQIKGDLDYETWRAKAAAALVELGGTAVFSHYVAINAVVSTLSGDDRVLSFRPDHASISVFETDGATLTLVTRGPEASTSVL